MRKYPKNLFVLALLVVLGCSQKNTHTQEPQVPVHKTEAFTILSTDSARLTIAMLGGAFVEFSGRNSINPFGVADTINVSGNDKKPTSKGGHFICLGQWGAPTPGEAKLGMPINGEASTNLWKLDSVSENRKLIMSCDAPLDGLSISRSVELSQSCKLFKVSEIIKNELSISRTNTVMQKLLFTAPFLDNSLKISSNATLGFNQNLARLSINRYEYRWPFGYTDSLKIAKLDMSENSDRFSYSSTHIFLDSIGWITFANRSLGIMLGYVWASSDYPWVHVKNEVTRGILTSKSFAFGTSGLGERFNQKRRYTTTFHNTANFDLIDARTSVTKTWYCFLVSIPKNYQTTSDVSIKDEKLYVRIKKPSGLKTISLTL